MFEVQRAKFVWPTANDKSNIAVRYPDSFLCEHNFRYTIQCIAMTNSRFSVTTQEDMLRNVKGKRGENTLNSSWSSVQTRVRFKDLGRQMKRYLGTFVSICQLVSQPAPIIVNDDAP